jgi:hypothetical protein
MSLCFRYLQSPACSSVIRDHVTTARGYRLMAKMFLSQDVTKDRYLEAQLLGGKLCGRQMDLSICAD